MNLENKKIMENLVEQTLAQGADACDIILSSGKSFSLSAQNYEIDTYKVSGSRIIGVRAIKDKKIGISYTEAFDENSLLSTAKKAVENSSFGEVNEYEKIELISEEDLIHRDGQESETVSTEEKIQLALNLEKAVKEKDKRVAATPYNGFSETTSEQYYLNSLGTFGCDCHHYFSCYTSALMKEGNKNSMFWDSTIAKDFTSLDYQKCVEESFKHAKNWLKADKIKTGKYDVIFDIDQLEELFGCFRGIFSAKRAKENTNPFSEKLGKQIASTQLTIIDMPHYQDAFFKSPFDSEGYISKDIALIKKGHLNELYHNSATARYFNTDNTARASRGAKSALGVSGTNLVIQAGESSEKDLLQGTYLMIHDMAGLHSGVNFMSGDFSFGAKGYLYKNGEVVQAVDGITVAGNFYQMLNGIAGLGNSLIGSNGKSFFAPIMRFDSLTVAGA